jgi:peroxiredoxin
MLKDRVSVAIITVTVLCVGSLMCFALAAGRAGDLLRSGGKGALVGEPAPNFSLYTPDNELVSLESYRGHPVLLNFWATWCSPCVEEMPLIQDRYLANRSTLVVLAINECESQADVVDFIEDRNLKLPVLLDKDCSVGDADFRINAYPTSIFIDADGVVQAMYVGSMSGSILDDNLQKIGIAP